MARLRANFVGGTVDDAPLAVGATTLTSTELADLPAVVAPDYAAVILDPNGVFGDPEIVYVTAHTASATTATILRAQEDTTAREHVSDTAWVHGNTAEDFHLNQFPAFSNLFDDPARWPADATGQDYEFDQTTTSLPSGWSWLNQGSATYSERFGVGGITAPATAGINWRGIVRSLASGDIEITAKLNAVAVSGNELGMGLVLREAATGEMLIYYHYSTGSSSSIYVVRWTSLTSSAGVSVRNGPLTPLPHGELPQYLRIVRTTTTYAFEYSMDGAVWMRHLSEDQSSYFTPDQIGFIGYNSSTNIWGISCDWIRFRTAGWTPLTPEPEATLPTILSPDNPDLWQASAYNQEFDTETSSLPTGWAWVNQGSATYAETKGAGVLWTPAASGNSLKIINRAIPSESTWEAVFKAEVTAFGYNYAAGGVVLRDSASGKIVWFSLSWGTLNLPSLVLYHFTNPTTWSATNTEARIMSPVRYWKIKKNSATSYDLQWSSDGRAWINFMSAYNPQTFLGTAPTHIGFGVEANNATYPIAAAVEWFRVTT